MEEQMNGLKTSNENLQKACRGSLDQTERGQGTAGQYGREIPQ